MLNHPYQCVLRALLAFLLLSLKSFIWLVKMQLLLPIFVATYQISRQPTHQSPVAAEHVRFMVYGVPFDCGWRL